MNREIREIRILRKLASTYDAISYYIYNQRMYPLLIQKPVSTNLNTISDIVDTGGWEHDEEYEKYPHERVYTKKIPTGDTLVLVVDFTGPWKR